MGTILLVDDNPLRSAMRSSMLEGIVSAVVRVQDAAEALCLAEDAEFVEHLLLVVTVHFEASTSSISGTEFVGELRTRLPRVPVLVLGALTAETLYKGLSAVYMTQTKSPQELRAVVNRLIGLGVRRSA